MNEKNFKELFSNLCCSRCRNDFNLDDLEIKQKKDNLMICHLKCHKCGKDFGEIVLNFNSQAKEHYPFEIIEGPPPISSDDVIDAHEFIKKNL